MTRLLQFVFALIVIVIGAAIIIPFVVPASFYRDQVQLAASEALHREVNLGGDLELSLLPHIEFRASQVSIANADGFGDAPFAEMGEMRLAVKLRPLLSRQIEITEFVLVDPVIRLQQSGARNNWTLTAAEQSAPASAELGFRRPGALPLDASFGEVRIENGTVSYSDERESHDVTGLDLTIGLPSLDGPMQLDGSLNADGEQLSFSARIASLRGFFEGRQTGFLLDLGGNLVTAHFDGNFLESADLSLDGAFNTTVPSIRNLARFAGVEMPAGDSLRRFSTAGRIGGDPTHIALTADTIRLDDITGSGTLNVNLEADKPRLDGALSLATLDVTPYLPEPAQETSAAAAGIAPWSEAAIDLAGFGLVNADLRLIVGSLKFRDLEVNDTRLRLRILNNRLEANLTQIALYQGQGTADIVVNGRTRTPSYSLRADLTGLDAQPFLTAAAGFERLRGIGNIELAFTGSGQSQAAIMQSLAGNGQFSFADGAITGINVAQTIRNVSSFVSGNGNASASDPATPAATGEMAQTDFSALTGSFTATSGRITNTDLLMLSPLLRITGAGWVNLPDQTVDYRLQPRAVASIQGQGGDRDLQGITVPVRIRGSFNNIAVGVDTEAVGQALLSGVVRNALGGSSGAATTPEQAVRNTLLNALGLSSDSANNPPAGSEPTQPQAEDPAQQLLRGLFNRGRATPPPDPAPADAPADPQ
ncbi:AsmA family protein [uncultured Maricaulis sp.]|uniref:AsmA family protein n=1 Tax=uncultured Maricaulis sp. TaxID=174710 RepID=UPI0030D80741|tara:strand:+ start:23466 stop:25583 length:2118 start_codon:yes stop_codon:yes gene_type:complete